MADIDQLSISITASAKTASEAIDDLANRLVNLRSQLGRINTKSFSKSLDRMATSASGLSQSMDNTGTAVKRTSSGLNLWSTSASKATKHSFSLASAIGKVYATYWMLFRAFGAIRKSIDIASDLTEVENVVDHSFKNMKSDLEDFLGTGGTNVMKNFGITELEAKRVASRFMSMGSNMDITSKAASDMSIELTKLAADLASFYNEDFATAAEKLNAVYTGQTRPLRQYGLDLTQATLKEWAMTQGLNSNIQAMTQAEKTLLRYQYVLAHTSDIQGDFARTSSTWANQVKLLKMQFQALGAVIGGAFINMLRPVLQKLTSWMNTVIKLVQKVVNAIGKLLGWQMEISNVSASDPLGGAATGAEELGQGLDDDTEKAKKLKQQLLGIDELNVLTTDKDDENGKANGGGSGAGAGGAGGAGAVSGGNVTFKPYESDIKDWYDLGKKIAEWLTDALNSIDWDSIQKKAREIAEKIADFINGFLDYEPLWIAIGHTIAQGMNTALYFAETLLDKIHWAQLGKDIGLMLNQWAREFDWAALGRVLAKGINAFFTVIYEAGKEFDPVLFGEGVYTAINNFFETLDTEKIANALNVWADNIFEFITTVINGLKWETIWDKAKTFLETINVRAVSLIIGGLLVKGLSKKALLGAVANAIGMPLGALGYIGSGITIAATIWFTLKLKDDVTDRFKKFNEAGGFSGTLKEIADRWREVAREAAEANKANPYTSERAADMQAFRDWIQQIKDKFTEAHEATKKYFDDLDGGKWSWVTIDGLKEKIGEIKDKFDSLTEEDVWDFLTIDGSYMAQFPTLSAAIDGVKQSIARVGERVKTVFSAETWAVALEGVKTAFQTAWQGIVDWWNNTALANWWTTNVIPWFSAEKWYTLWEGVLLGIQTKWLEIVTWWNETALVTWWEEDVLPWFTVEKWLEVFQGIYDAITQKWDEIATWWRETAIFNWWESDVKPWFSFDTWYELVNGVWEGLKARWKDINDWWRDTAIFNWWENDVKPWFSYDTWYEIANGIWDGLKQRWSDITDWWRNTAMHDWIENDVKPKFTKEFWTNILQGVVDAWSESWTKITTDVKDKVGDMYNKVAGWLQELAGLVQKIIDGVREIVQKAGSGMASNIMANYGLPYDGYASGGYVSSEIFMARENGIPEMVGRIGRSTAVANNDQIVEAISLGVAMANSGVIDGLSQVVSAINNKDTSVNIGDRQIALAAVSGQSQLGRSIIR